MNIIDEKLNYFDPVSLEEMDAVKLMNRTDTKFIFSISQLPAILESLQNDYRILEISGKRNTHYETRYFDTLEHRLYLQHHNGKLNRVKVRFRNYVDSNLSFFEVKAKSNKGRTIKKRITSEEIKEEITGKSKQLLEKTTSLTSELLIPALWVCYSRITLVNINMTERMTIDTGLHFKNNLSEIQYSNIVIAEIKQEKHGRSFFQTLMQQHHIPEFRISKYCLGIISLNQKIKQNRFKIKFNHIKKINHELN